MPWVDHSNAGLLTDLYEFTMSASYHARGMTGPATFDLFIRELPEERNFLVACGLEQCLDFLENLSFNDEAIDYLRSLGIFAEDFLSHLTELEFTGDVMAVAEGEIVFAGEPLVSVTAPLIEAQIVETFLLNCVTYETTVASKAARVSLACGGKQFVDFSPRRDHGADAALKAARASFVGGASGTSNVLAGKVYGIPVSGTMAHSYVMAFDSEIEAFRAFASDFPDRAVLLIDTFDVEEGARRAVRVFKELEAKGIEPRGVRIDSGDLGPLARSVRKILDEAGLTKAQVMLSGDLDEYRIKELLDDDVPADAFGVGTRMGTSADAPSLGSAYKLVADSGGPKIKLSTGKVTLPGRKQVYRVESENRYERDIIASESERIEEGRPLLHKVMSGGRRTNEPVSLETLQGRCQEGLRKLPKSLTSLTPGAEHYPVEISNELSRVVGQMKDPTLYK